ncbi:MAG: AI-2E family transporter, partial [Telluria sp.]
MNQYTLQQKFFLLLLVVVTLGFGWILLPFAGAVFWGVVLAILFAPLYRHLLRATRQKPNLSALIALLSILVMVILPLTLIGASLVEQAARVYEMIRQGQIDFGAYFRQVVQALPQWLVTLLERFELTDLSALQQRLSDGASQVSQAIGR